MKAFRYHVSFFVFGLMVAGCATTGAPSPAPVIESYTVMNIDPLTSALDPHPGNTLGVTDIDNPGSTSNRIFRKRFSMMFKSNNTAINRVRFEFNYNSPTSTAMFNPMTMNAIATGNSGDGRLAFTTPDFTPPSDAAACDWIHYRWMIEYSRSDGSNGILVGQLQPLQMNGYIALMDSGPSPRTAVCDPIPQE